MQKTFTHLVQTCLVLSKCSLLRENSDTAGEVMFGDANTHPQQFVLFLFTWPRKSRRCPGLRQYTSRPAHTCHRCGAVHTAPLPSRGSLSPQWDDQARCRSRSDLCGPMA